MIESRFYENLGKILYAIAKADGVVQDKEVTEIEKQIHHEIKELKHFRFPESGELLLTKLSFENSRKENLSMKDASRSFISFIRKYGNMIPDHSKQTALSLIDHAAQAYHGINKEEAKLLGEIKKDLKINQGNISGNGLK